MCTKAPRLRNGPNGDGHFAQGRFAGHQAGDEQKGGKGRDARDQRDQRQAEGLAQDAEHEHEFDVAEPHGRPRRAGV